MDKKLALFIIIFGVLPSYGFAAGGCCLNPATFACEYVSDLSVCCPDGGSCAQEFFQSGGLDACTTLPPGKAELCTKGCCCERETNTETQSSQSVKAACTGANKLWGGQQNNCTSYCTTAFNQIHTADNQPPEWWHPGDGPVCWVDDDGSHHCYDPDKTATTAITTTTKKTTATETTTKKTTTTKLIYDGLTPQLPPGSECHKYGGLCRASLFVPLGADPCGRYETQIEDANCGIFSRCCMIGKTDLKASYDSKTSYELVVLGRYTSEGKIGFSFQIPEQGTLWADIKAKSHYLASNQYSRITVNGKQIAKVTNGERELQIPVNQGDYVFADANGYICFLFLCMASASVDLAFGTSTAPQLGTDIEVFNQGSGFTDVYAGEASDSKIVGCKIEWGDGTVNEVPTKGFGIIRRLTHLYNTPRDYAIRYTCNDSSGATSSDWGKMQTKGECFTPSDCRDKSPGTCDGDWSCDDGNCVWKCAGEEDQGTSSGASKAKQEAIEKCISYCSSEDAATQAQFFAINPSLSPFISELNIDNTDCTAVMDDISECAPSFITEFNAMIDRVIS